MAKKRQKFNKNRIAELRKKQAQQVKKIGTKTGANPTKVTHLYSTGIDTKTGMETVITTEFHRGKVLKRTTTATKRDVVIYKDGEIVNKKAYKALEEATSKGKDRGLIFRQTVRKWKSTSKTYGSVTARHMLSTMIQDDIERMLFNQDKPLSLIAAEAGTSEQELLNPSNWDGSVFTNPVTGEKFQFEFRYNYDGSTNMVRITEEQYEEYRQKRKKA